MVLVACLKIESPTPLEANLQFLRQYPDVGFSEERVMIPWDDVDLQSLGGYLIPTQPAIVARSLRRLTAQEEGDSAWIDLWYIVAEGLAVCFEDLLEGTR